MAAVYLQVVQSKTVQMFQSLEERGTTAQFKAVTATKVRADGRSVRVPIGRVQLKAREAIVAAPEQSLNAARTLEMVNEGDRPLLPGKVALYQAGTFLGMTNVDFVAAGEPFALFLCVADQIKLSRILDKKHQCPGAEATHADAARLRRDGREPLLQGDLAAAGRSHPGVRRQGYRDQRRQISPDAKPDSKGILRWPLTLQPKETRKLEIQYQIEYPPTLVLEMKRNKEPRAAAKTDAPSPSPESSSPAPPAAARARDLKTDIQHLEEAF